MNHQLAVVTGAARGIGKGIAEVLAHHHIHVVMVDKDESLVKKASNEIGSYTSAYCCDVSIFQSINTMVYEVNQKYGRIDILVNNAGVSPKRNGVKVPIYEMDPSEWQQVVDVNLTGTFNCTRAVAPYMMDRNYGRIINMSSIAAKSFISVSGGHYASTKAGIIGFTKAAAGELAPYGITVNALAPGRIQTEMMDEVDTDSNNLILSQIASGKFGKAEDVGAAVEFLASEKANYITGTVLNIDGGWVMA